MFYRIGISVVVTLLLLVLYRGGAPVQKPAPPQISKNPTGSVNSLPSVKILSSEYQVFQSFNNCGPAALSMALRYYGINKSQEELGAVLRPWQNAAGDNDDKSVTLQELGKQAQQYGLLFYHRPNGSIDMLRRFIAADMPVITRTWLHLDEDIGHYRVVNGYDDTTEELIQQDSMEGNNLRYKYDTFNELWKNNNYEYVVLVPREKQAVAEQILGADRDVQHAWRSAHQNAKKQLSLDPDDVYARFNASIALYHLNNYEESIKEFEQIEDKLAWRTLWYQIEPILAYEKVGNHTRVFQITDAILNNQNRAFSELYLVRGRVYEQQGNNEAAETEYQKAVYYNSNYKEARDALLSLQKRS